MTQLLPLSAQQDHKALKLTERYKFLDTREAISVLEMEGWFLRKSSEVKTKDPSRRGFQKHMLRFQEEGDRGNLYKGQIKAELTIVNSHDGSAAFHLYGGMFVVWCTNGAMTSIGSAGNYTMRHNEYSQRIFAEMIKDLGRKTHELPSTIATWQEIEMTKNDQEQYVMEACEMKYGKDPLRGFDVQNILKSRFNEDATPSLFSTFNKVQEKLIEHGGYYIINNNPESSQYERVYHAKPIKAVGESVRLNTSLWSQTERWAKEYGG